MCPSGWLKVGDHCFKRNNAFKTWRKSLANCESSLNTGSLASIRSVQEQSALSNLLGTNDAWIGLNDIDNEGVYVWADRSSLVYVNWRAAEKLNSSMKISHSCVALNGEGYWKASNCVEEKQSVCVIPAFSGKCNFHYHRFCTLIYLCSLFKQSRYLSRSNGVHKNLVGVQGFVDSI